MSSHSAPISTVDPGASIIDSIDSMVHQENLRQIQKSKTTSFTAYSLKSVLISIEKLREDFESDFVDSVVGANTTAKTVCKTIVYVEELSSYLPQPTLEAINLISADPAQLSEAERKLALDAMEKISRFPVGYSISGDGNLIPIKKQVTIEFEKDYDYSAGIIR